MCLHCAFCILHCALVLGKNMEVKVNHVNEPNFVEFTVKTRLPKELQRLDEISHNLWWV